MMRVAMGKLRTLPQFPMGGANRQATMIRCDHGSIASHAVTVVASGLTTVRHSRTGGDGVNSLPAADAVLLQRPLEDTVSPHEGGARMNKTYIALGASSVFWCSRCSRFLRALNGGRRRRIFRLPSF
jgi:hypothetical protein